MKKITKILFPTDFSDSAVNAFLHALLLADKIGASIEVVHAVYPQAEGLDMPVMVAQATQTQVEAAREVMGVFVDNGIKQLENQLSRPPLIETDIQVGVPVSVICQIGKRDHATLVIMGTRGKHLALEKALGTVAAGVVSRAGCPVMVIPEGAPVKTPKTIAYATDLRDADPYEIWKVSKLFNPFNAIFRVVHFSSTQSYEDTLELEEMKAFFSDHAPALQIHFHHLSGKSLSDDLLEFAKNFEVDLLVMFQPKRGFLERIFHRSKTVRMTENTQVPLFVIKE